MSDCQDLSLTGVEAAWCASLVSQDVVNDSSVHTIRYLVQVLYTFFYLIISKLVLFHRFPVGGVPDSIYIYEYIFFSFVCFFLFGYD